MSGPVVKVDSYHMAADSDEVSDNSYKGMRIHALTGLHEFVVAQAEPYFPRGSSIVDLGAGSGAMSARLSDLGYAVSSVDIVTQNYRLRDKLPFY